MRVQKTKTIFLWTNKAYKSVSVQTNLWRPIEIKQYVDDLTYLDGSIIIICNYGWDKKDNIIQLIFQAKHDFNNKMAL